MKRKLISILLIIMMLSVSFITLPVNAKILNDWTASGGDWIEGGFIDAENAGITEDTVYDRLDEYVNIHCEGGVFEKSYITKLVLSGGSGVSLSIRDLSDIYTYTNLTELVLWNIGDDITQAALDTLDFSRLPNLEKLYIEGVDITNLEIGELENLTYLEILDPRVHTTTNDLNIPIDLSGMDNLEYFSYNINLPEGTNNAEEIATQVGSYITVPQWLKVWKYIEYETQTGNVAIYFSLIDVLKITVGCDKSNYSINEPVTCYVSSNRKIGATEFILNFDATKLEFVGADIEEEYYNADYAYEGEVSVAWADLNEVGIDTIKFMFKAIGDGKTEISASVFEWANGDLDTDFEYDTSSSVMPITIETDYIKNDAPIEVIDINEMDVITGLELKDNKITLQNFIDANYFDDGITVKASREDLTEIAANEGLGSGSYIYLYNGEEIVRELIAMVYGDVSGDGEITALDALTIIKVRNNKLDYSLPVICLEAGKVFSDHEWSGGPTAIDALAIIKHLNGKYEISQNY